MPELKDSGRIYDDFFGESSADKPAKEENAGLSKDLMDDIDRIREMALSDFDAITQADDPVAAWERCRRDFCKGS